MRKVYKESILTLAESQVGYCEKGSNSQLDEWTVNKGSANYQKYSRDLDAVHYFNGAKQSKEWCAQFINWLFWFSSGKDVNKTKECLCIPKDAENLSAGVEFIRKYFRAVGRYDAKPQVGDLIIFTTTKGSTNADHIGLITDIGSDGRIYTIEGNHDNKVDECAYPKDYWKILGFAHPKYDVADTIHSITVGVDGKIIFDEEI